MKIKNIVLVILFMSVVQFSFSKNDVKAVWYNVYQINTGNVLEAKSQIDLHFRTMKKMGINRVFFLVKNPNGRVYYKSKILKPILNSDFVTNNNDENSWDVLEYVIKKSRENSIKIYPYINVFAESGYYLKENPSFAEKSVYGGKYEWASPAIKEVKERVVSIVEEIVKNYDIDGIQLDRIRYEDSNAGFNEVLINGYRAECGKEPDLKDCNFKQYRKDLITEFVGELYKKVKEIKPGIEFSAAVFHSPKTAENVMQDWPEWVKRNYVDYVYTMSYTNNETIFKTFLNDNLNVFKDEKIKAKLVIGVGAYYKNMTPEILVNQVKAIYESQKAEGVCYFSFYNMIDDKFYKVLSANEISGCEGEKLK